MFICWTSVSQGGQPSLSSIRMELRGICCPSDLGECSLVRCCSFRTCMGFLGMDCNVLAPEGIVLETFLFLKVTIFSTASVFDDFQTLKIWVPPNSPCFKGFSLYFYIQSHVPEDSGILLHPEVFRTALPWSVMKICSVVTLGDMGTIIHGICLVSFCLQFTFSHVLFSCESQFVLCSRSLIHFWRLHLPVWNWWQLSLN